jgi:hypothetical protein
MCPAGRDKDGARSSGGGKVGGGGERVKVESEDGPTAIIMEGARPWPRATYLREQAAWKAL